MSKKHTELIRQAQAGDQEAFGELVCRYQGLVYGWAFNLLGDFGEAEDIAQEVFLEAYLCLSRLQDPDKFLPWLRQMTYYHCVDRLRQRKDYVPLEMKCGDVLLEGKPYHSEPLLEENCDACEVKDQIRKALSMLPENNRIAISLFYFSGKSYKEIADFLGVPVSTIEGRLYRAKRQLREVLVMIQNNIEQIRPDESFTKKVLEKVQVIPSIRWWVLFDVLKRLGYDTQIFQGILKNPDIPAPSPEEYRAIKERAWEAVKKSVDHGVPAIAWQPMTLEQQKQGMEAYEWALLVGYDLKGKTYTVQHIKAGEYPVPYDGFGYTDPVNWFCVIVFNSLREFNQTVEECCVKIPA